MACGIAMGLTALQRGGVSAIGTMFQLYVDVPKIIEDALVDGIRPPDGQTNDGALVNVARILQQAATALRAKGHGADFWGPLAQYGTPVVRLGHGWAPKGAQAEQT